ncbi:hypothetical protein FA13DRAFT_111620 [Coprinellus micaceus]|uniref:Uncharacterized protein n=1 Tax=Coprinellus micaceus TaxID=71717 RepID=A0A4Y7THV3_COPMI|nr:hypothetical protein FA13DRAFT_111620 [Coprinellus micaceus]
MPLATYFYTVVVLCTPSSRLRTAMYSPLQFLNLILLSPSPGTLRNFPFGWSWSSVASPLKPRLRSYTFSGISPDQGLEDPTLWPLPAQNFWCSHNVTSGPCTLYLHPQGGLISVRFLSIHGWLDSTYSPKPKDPCRLVGIKIRTFYARSHRQVHNVTLDPF